MANKDVAVAVAADDSGKPSRKSRLKSAMGEVGSDKRKSRRKVVNKIYSLLISTPADDSGVVEGTPFSKAGVARLMDLLKTRSEDGDKPGARAAGGMLKFLTPDDENTEAVSGASVKKLQWIAKMGKRKEK